MRRGRADHVDPPPPRHVVEGRLAGLDEDLAVHGQPVQEDQRAALAADLVIDLVTVDGESHRAQDSTRSVWQDGREIGRIAPCR